MNDLRTTAQQAEPTQKSLPCPTPTSCREHCCGGWCIPRAALAQQAEPMDSGYWGRVAARQASRIKQLETTAQQALEALEHHGGNLPWNAFVEVRKDLRDALAQQAEPAQEPITRLFGTLPVHDAQQDEPAQQTRKDGRYSVAYRCKCGHEQNVTEIVHGGRTYAGSGANWCDGCGDGLPVRVDAMQQQQAEAVEGGA